MVRRADRELLVLDKEEPRTTGDFVALVLAQLLQLAVAALAFEWCWGAIVSAFHLTVALLDTKTSVAILVMVRILGIRWRLT